MDTMQAPPVYDRTVEDVGNIVEFGHVNVLVPDQSLATLFYVSGLGLTRDPYLMTSTDNMWINVGAAQFHLPSGPAQVVRGEVGLVVPSLDSLRARLTRVAPMLSGTAFGWQDSGDSVLAICPWGNRIRCHAPADRFGPVVLGMPYVRLDTPRGTAARIARFYQNVLGATARVAGDAAVVPMGTLTQVIWQETDAPLPSYDGHHLQMSLADFSGPHRRLLSRGLITEESDQHQYRFCDLVDPETGDVLVSIEHEVRSMRHPLFARALVNRNAEQSNRMFAAGREELAWTMPVI